MLFSEIIGQKLVSENLQEMVQHNRLSHALLFSGKEGSGALMLAMAFAQYIVCEKVQLAANPAPSLFGDAVPAAWPKDACGECSPCQKAKALAHPDIHFSYPVIPRKAGDKPVSTDYINEWREFVKQLPYGNVYDWLQFIGAENKQGNITAQECNDIIRKLSMKSFESEYKFLLLWMPEYLGNEGNKLLKLIEEPPPNTLFILITENPSLVLQTIISRTQLVKIPSLETNEIEQALVDRNKTPSEQARQIASLAEGNYREALELVRNAGEDFQSLFREWLNAIMKTGPVAQVRWIEEMAKLGREKQKQFLRYCNHLLQQSIRSQMIPGLNVPENERDFANRISRLAGINEQQALIEEFDRAAYYIERNANAKMLFHALTIRVYHIISDKSLILMT